MINAKGPGESLREFVGIFRLELEGDFQLGVSDFEERQASSDT